MKKVRSGEDGFKHGRGSEDGRTGRSVMKGEPNVVPESHGYGHKGKQIKGFTCRSGSAKAHRIGCK